MSASDPTSGWTVLAEIGGTFEVRDFAGNVLARDLDYDTATRLVEAADELLEGAGLDRPAPQPGEKP